MFCRSRREREKTDEGAKVFSGPREEARLRIVSGSENRLLEPLLARFAKEQSITVEMHYMGSLDIMRLLDRDEIPYDAVWPASSLWISLGDTQHRIKHTESTSSTPVIFGIRRSLAEDLGFVGREVRVKDILEAIRSGRLKFTMTSATQSNSGASAYIGFIYALLGSPAAIRSEDLQKEEFRDDIKSLLGGVERSSGSSDWLKDPYLQGDYDAMVNYEALIISANQELERQKRETLYAVYPSDGMMMADSPLGFISSNGEAKRDEKKQEEAFLKLQDFLMSDESQYGIQRTGRRTGVSKIDPKNEDVFRKSWGIDTERVINTINMPKKDVLFEALELYQTAFKKPGLNIYVLDFSGSMYSEGRTQLLEALKEIMLKQKASENFLQASEQEKNIFIPFNESTFGPFTAVGPDALEALYDDIANMKTGGGTHLYEALDEAFAILQKEDLSQYSPAVIVMTDGMPNGKKDYFSFVETYRGADLDVPVFSILFGSAREKEMKKLAELTRARVFDGSKDLTQAFRTVRGYN